MPSIRTVKPSPRANQMRSLFQAWVSFSASSKTALYRINNTSHDLSSPLLLPLCLLRLRVPLLAALFLMPIRFLSLAFYLRLDADERVALTALGRLLHPLLSVLPRRLVTSNFI